MLPELTMAPLPENGAQALTPVFEDIQPGTDYEVCTWTDVFIDEQTDVRSTLAFQTEPPGHHAVVFYTTTPQPAGTQRVCTDNDMASFRFLTGNGGAGEVNEAPGNLVYRIPAGAQLVINSHYLNTSSEVLRGQTVVNLNFAEPGDWIPSGNTAILNSGLNVEEGVTTQSMHCEFDRQLKLWYLIPHMHRWGSNMKIDLTIAGEQTRLFDTDWDESYTFHPPEDRRDPTTPLIVNVGDEVDIECTWNNDEGRPLAFGFEMCVAFGQFVDDAGLGNWACDNGTWGAF